MKSNIINDFRSYEKQGGHHFKNIFSYMENSGALDPDDERDLAALELEYTRRINQSLEEFSNRSNNHPLSPCHKKGPLQLIEMEKLSRLQTKTHQIASHSRPLATPTPSLGFL